MNGRERICRVFGREPVDRPGVLPIVHSGLASLFSVSLGQFFCDAEVMSDVIIRGCRRFGYDGVQLSMGVTAEAEALGARVAQPQDGGAILKEHLLADL